MKKPSLVKGLAAGALGGLAASWVMNQFQQWLSAALKTDGGEPHGAQAVKPGAPRHGAAGYLQKRGLDSRDDNAVERTANFVSSLVLDHPLTKREKKTFGTAFHYSLGATSGGIYGLSVELTPKCAMGLGVPYGTAVWLLADEGLVPALGLAELPHRFPLKHHAIALTSHVVYGFSTDILRRIIRRVL